MTATSFKDFTRLWGGVLVHDSAVSLEHLFDVYRRADEAEVRPATIDDYTDLWTAAKRANKEWEATCMVRSVRQSVARDSTVTPVHLMTAMVCWAATLHQRNADFFKVCSAQIRDVVAQVVARCSAWGPSGDDDSGLLYDEIAFCVALELFGWHTSLLTCLRTVALQLPGPADERDVLLYIGTVAQYLTPRHVQRGLSTDSTPNITPGRTSALSSSSEPDAVGEREEVAVASDYAATPPERCSTQEAPSTLQVRCEHSRAVGTAAAATAVAPRERAAVTPLSPMVPLQQHRGPPPPPTHAPPASPTGLRSAAAAPLQPPRSRGTPQPSPQNSSAPSPTSAAAAATAVSPTTTPDAVAAARERARKDAVKEKRWPIAPKKGRRPPKANNQGCTAF